MSEVDDVKKFEHDLEDAKFFAAKKCFTITLFSILTIYLMTKSLGLTALTLTIAAGGSAMMFHDLKVAAKTELDRREREMRERELLRKENEYLRKIIIDLSNDKDV